MSYEKFQCLQTLTNHTGSVKALAIRSYDSLLFSGGWDSTIKCWSLKSGQEVKTLKLHRRCVNTIAISPDGKILASGSDDKMVKLFSLETGETLHELEHFAYEASPADLSVKSVVFSRDGKIIYTATKGINGYYWDVSTGKKLGDISGSRLALSQNGAILAICYCGTLMVRGRINKKPWYEVDTGHGTFSITITHDGKTIFLGGRKRDIHLWNTNQGKKYGVLQGHQNTVRTLALSPDGKILASGSEDQTIKLWDWESRQELCTLRGHSGIILSLVFSPNGKELVSGSMDKTIKIWGIP